MQYAIKYLGSLGGRKIAVLGDMKELGDYSIKLHKDIGKLIYEEKIDVLITVGNDSKYINETLINYGFNKSNCYHFENNEEAIKLINKIKKHKDNILVKASNSMNFKEIINNI